MQRLRSVTRSAVRWGWFGFLMLLAFGYLAAGLSEPERLPEEEAAAANLNVVANQVSSGRSDHPIASTVADLNLARTEFLDAQSLDSAPMADWMTVCRRMSLALVGSGLSLEELRQLEALPEEVREATHLENLLQDPRFHHYWAERWSRFLVGTDEGQFIVYRRRRFRIWLAEQFAADIRYDNLVRRLITAEGLWTDKPEVNFLTSTFDSNDNQPDPIRLAARTSRAFLGLRIDCLQCHNDFLGNVNLGDVESPREGLQSDFHQLAAFYTSAKSNGLQGVRSGKVEYEYKYLHDDHETDVEASVPYSPELLPEDGDARRRLADWITHPKNRQAARAAVSHIWALMFGRPMGESVDNLPLDESCHPVMERLADDFVQHDYDMRRLIRLIAASEMFRVDSRAEFEITEAHERTGAVFPLTRMRPEQIAGAVTQAARIKRTDQDSSFILQLQTFGGVNDFVNRYGDMGEDEFTSDSVTISQRLAVMNGNMVKELVEPNPVLNTTSHIHMFAKDDPLAVDAIYLCCLNRYPTDAERDHFCERLDEPGSREQKIRDIMWVLVNSSEMAWNH